ncbi:MAG: hypothetical protein K940chlam3_00906 [Chlamydiae bacterium]|nr:hypothetical protein [Chlamydiota bacterium]
MIVDAKESESPILNRIKNNSFLINSHDCPIIIRVKGVIGNGRLSYLVAAAAARVLMDDETNLSETINVAGKPWTIAQKKEEGGRLWSLFNLVHMVYLDTHARTYDVYDNSWWLRSPTIEEEIEATIPFFDHFVIQASTDRSFMGLFEPYERELFTDPFTKLATTAFQEYETCFGHKDHFQLSDSDYRIVYYDEQFSLVKRDHPIATNPEVQQRTAEMYLTYIKEKYGEEKIQEIDYRYSLELDKLIESNIGVTPEHVYRVNIGVNNVDMYDVKRLWNALCKIYQMPQCVSHKMRLDEYLESLSISILPRERRRALYYLIKERVKWRDPVKGDLIMWLYEVTKNGTIEDPEETTVKTFDTLMSLLIPGNEACERSLTGRKIYGFIRSYYSNAESGVIKPWVDQQELFQTIILLRNQFNEDLFLEKLAHVVVKKRLARKSLKGDYRVGILLPAPVKEDGLQHWYRVTSCISTPTGLLSYTLNAATSGDVLDKMKLYRSTDSIVSPSSVYNDLNAINSPGYEGRNIAEPYEYSFFKESTIPIWVAYTILAKRKLENLDPYVVSIDEVDAIYQDLLSANASLDHVLTTDYKKKDFRSIIRENDVILNELYRLKKLEQYKRWKTSCSFGSYTKILGFLTGAISSEDVQSEEKIAQELFDQLEVFSEHEEDPARKYDIVRLKDQLFRHVLVYHEHSFLSGIESKRTSYCDILNFKRIYHSIEKESDKLTLLTSWINRLEMIAEELEENIEEKIGANLTLLGHSLGGAAASSHIVYYLVDKDRVPLPGHQCMGYFWCDPGINDEDNEKFKLWGWKHKDLFRELEIAFCLKRRLEVGDVVALGGEVHLGATFSEEEDARLKEWLKYDFRLRERLENASNLAIALSSSAHETQFEEGQVYDPESGEGDYIETEIPSHVLGRFDHRGKIVTLRDEETDSFVRHEVEGEKKNENWLEILDIWKLGGIHARVESEWVRTNRYISLLYYLLYGSDDVDRILDLTDERGVFAVMKEGVITRRIEREIPEESPSLG